MHAGPYEVELRFKEVNYSPPKEEGVFLEILDKTKSHRALLTDIYHKHAR